MKEGLGGPCRSDAQTVSLPTKMGWQRVVFSAKLTARKGTLHGLRLSVLWPGERARFFCLQGLWDLTTCVLCQCGGWEVHRRGR